MKAVYLDYNATTPIDREVALAMQPLLSGIFGNPSSNHAYGFEAREILEISRKQVAGILNCKTEEIVFTSGGTEANNYAIRGAAEAKRQKGRHIITNMVEHPAILEVCRFLEKSGYQVTYLRVDQSGKVDVDDFRKAIRPDTILVSIMHANNEIGTVQPISELAGIASERGILFHTDAAQSLGKILTDVSLLGVDLLSVAGHKVYGPKGIGALYIRSGVVIEKLMHGANHEGARRAGTENVLEIAGFGKACEIAMRDFTKNTERMKKTRDVLDRLIREALPDVVRNGDQKNSLPNTLSLSFPGTEADLLLSGLPEIAASAGAACHTQHSDISHVLQAIGLPESLSMGTIRFSTGKETTDAEILESSRRIIEKAGTLMTKSGFNKTTTQNNAMEIKLTEYTHGGGCACKLRPQYLEKILERMPVVNDKRVLVGISGADDAAVYQLSETSALIQTVDFFTPVVDDPFDFGCIAAANAISDVYAMGGVPAFALNIVGFPTKRLSLDILKKILEGAESIAREAGIHILGGHSIEDPEPKFGMVVSGFVHPDKLLRNSGANPGDVLILTKKIGTGILSSCLKKGVLSLEDKDDLINNMKTLNKRAAEVMDEFPVSACTDVTGFGLLGHLLEMVKASKVSAEVEYRNVPVLNGVFNGIENNMIPGGSLNNLDYVDPYTSWGNEVSKSWKYCLSDAQTSGGLLISVPEKHKESILSRLRKNGVPSAYCIGRIIHKEEKLLYIS